MPELSFVTEEFCDVQIGIDLPLGFDCGRCICGPEPDGESYCNEKENDGEGFVGSFGTESPYSDADKANHREKCDSKEPGMDAVEQISPLNQMCCWLSIYSV